MHTLVILNNINNYIDALHEKSIFQESYPGRKGYPTSLYSDLAEIYEQAGMLQDKNGSITLIPVIAMYNDDPTHPIPDTSGQLLDGQIVLRRDLHYQKVYPPIDPIASMTRHYSNKGMLYNNQRELINQIQANYIKGNDALLQKTVIGKEAMKNDELFQIEFKTKFERQLLAQVLIFVLIDIIFLERE